MKKQSSKITILFFVMVVVMLGFGIVIPILPFYVETMSASAQSLGILMAIFSIAQFISAPIWGNLSDRIGRKPLLMIGLLGSAVGQILFGLSTQFWMLLVSRALTGILSSATMPTAMAYISDSTTEENRSGGMGMLGAAMGVGMVLGPGLGGWLGQKSLSLPFFGAAAVTVLAFFLVLILLPESLPVDQRITNHVKGQSQLVTMFSALSGPAGFLFILAFLVSFAMTSFEGIFALFASHRFQYGPEQVGTIMTVIGLLSAVAQGGLTGPLSRRFGDHNVIKASLIGTAIGFAIMLTARNFTGVLLTTSFFVLSNNMLRPGIASLISRNVENQGSAQGLNNAFMSLGRIVGPLWAGFMFDINLDFPYLSSAAIMLVSFVLSLMWLNPISISKPTEAIPAISENN